MILLSQLDPCWTCFRTEIDFEFKKMSPERGGGDFCAQKKKKMIFRGIGMNHQFGYCLLED